MYKKLRLYLPIIYLLMVLCGVLVLLTALVSSTLFFICGAVALVAFAVVLIMLRTVNKKTDAMLQEIDQAITHTLQGNLIDFPVPVITVYDGVEIIWYNEQCAKNVFAMQDMRGQDIAKVFPELDITQKSPAKGYSIEYGQGKQYTVHVSAGLFDEQGQKTAIIYLVDDTELKYYVNEYYETKPIVALVMIDNYEELVQDYKDGERARIVGEVETLIENYFTTNFGFINRIKRDAFIVVIQERGIKKLIENKFSLLDQVRGKHMSTNVATTLSIGIGRAAKSLSESETMAKQALDMCLGRGGDQVAIKTENGYDFYGGISKGVERRTKVKTRIIATALGELIESSSNVIIMGHRFSDLDCLGSGIGMLKAVKDMNRPAVIVMDPEKHLVEPLMQRIEQGGYYKPTDFVTPAKAMENIQKNTLLIVVDTHVPEVLESKEVYKACRNVVVIDHHRKLASYIDNAVIFYHEPYASSTSEMVTELVQYFPTKTIITKIEAEAMMAGIMLDTKSFAFRTGVRTFEAAAYLRKLGADTVEVRKLFASSIESYQKKTNVVSSAEIYHKCAIACSELPLEDGKVIAPQAADELMTISGVEASFVIFVYGGDVNVSARSMGSINVQVIMEKMGGGGHQTMAAAQFPNGDVEEVRGKIMKCIDEYFASLIQIDAV